MIDLKTIIKNGGCTLNADLKNASLKTGFMVSLEGCEVVKDIKDITGTLETIQKYQNIIKDKKNTFIGLWINNNKMYIDISKNIKNKRDAINKGIKNNQLAIYDLKNNCDIELTKNVYIVYKYLKNNNDYKYIKEYYNTEDIKKDYNIKDIYNYTARTLDDSNNLINGLYKIIIERVPLADLEG